MVFEYLERRNIVVMSTVDIRNNYIRSVDRFRVGDIDSYIRVKVDIVRFKL